MYVCVQMDGRRGGRTANNGMKTMRQFAVVDVALCLTLLLAAAPLLVQLGVCRNTLLFFISDWGCKKIFPRLCQCSE